MQLHKQEMQQYTTCFPKVITHLACTKPIHLVTIAPPEVDTFGGGEGTHIFTLLTQKSGKSHPRKQHWDFYKPTNHLQLTV
jgi:hypothetical protein